MVRLDESSKSYSRKNVNALDERIKEAVWKFEDLFDSHVYNQIFPLSQILDVVEVHLDEIKHEIESFTKKLEEFKVEYMYELFNMFLEGEVDVDVDVVSSASADSGCKMVGSFYYLWAHIRRHLEIESSLDVLSFVGMAGIGKTTLAKKIFDDPLITEFEFGCRAWVTIGRKWEPEKLIRDIITQLEYHGEEGERNEGYYLNGVSNPILRSEIVALPAPLPMLPSSLIKLHLSGLGYPWSYMSVIGSLPHLQVLKLGTYAFRGAVWVVKYGQFPTLKVLKIGGTDLVKFKVEARVFVGLRILCLSDCYKLRDIQWEHDKCSPLIIIVNDCSTSIVAFANKHNSVRDSHIPEEHTPEYVASS